MIVLGDDGLEDKEKFNFSHNFDLHFPTSPAFPPQRLSLKQCENHAAAAATMASFTGQQKHDKCVISDHAEGNYTKQSLYVFIACCLL